MSAPSTSVSHIRSARLQQLQEAAEEAQRRRMLYENELSDRNINFDGVDPPSQKRTTTTEQLHGSIVDHRSAHDASASSGETAGDDDYAYASPPSIPAEDHDMTVEQNGPSHVTQKMKRGCGTAFSRLCESLEQCVEHRFGTAVLVVLLIISVAVGYVVHVTKADEVSPDYNAGGGFGVRPGAAGGASGGSSSNDSSELRAFQIQAKLEELSGKEAIEDPRTHQSSAARWLIHDDEMRLPSDSPYLLQRYVLAVLYYGLDMDDCSNFDDADASSGGSGRLADWLTGTWECSWHGITCNESSFVTELHLDHLGLTGRIPHELANAALPELRHLDLCSNRIVGTVPSELGSLTVLERLRLADNDLVGSVPESLCELVTRGMLRELTVDCGGEPPPGGGDGNVEVEVRCGCCTGCSSAGGGNGGAMDGGGGVGAGGSTSESYSPKPQQQRDEADENAIRAAIAEVSPGLTTTPGTAQYRALDWILNVDARRLHADDGPALVQRYVLAVLYFAMGGEAWRYPQPWLDGSKSECHFVGVACNERGRVVDISLGE